MMMDEQQKRAEPVPYYPGEAPEVTEAAFTSCREAVTGLYPYLDRNLDPLDQAEVVTHLSECRPCAEVFEFYAGLQRVVKARCRLQVPDGLRDRIIDSVTLD